MYTCMCIYIYIYIYVYGGFPRPALTKNTQVNTFYERNEEHIPYKSKTHGGYMTKACPTLLGMLSWRASGYA